MTTKAIATLLCFTTFALPPVFADASGAPAADPEPPPPELEELDFDTVLDDVHAAQAEINRGKFDSGDDLAAALAQLNQSSAEFAGDEAVLETRRLARLNLARAYYMSKQLERASEEMDTAIRESLGGELPAGDFGPDLESFYFERMAELDALGWGAIEVACELPCQVYINENEVGSGAQELPPGSYRLVVESTSGERDDLRTTIELSEADQPRVIPFGPPPKPEPEPVPPPQRMMPRGAEIALVVLGAGVSMAGAGLTGAGSVNGVNGRAGLLGVGIPFMLIGLSSLAAGTVTLSIDEARVGQAVDRRAFISWKAQF